MSLTTIQKMLSALVDYKDCEIVHTFSANNKPLISIHYQKETGLFKMTNLRTQECIMFADSSAAAAAIHEIIQSTAN